MSTWPSCQMGDEYPAYVCVRDGAGDCKGLVLCNFHLDVVRRWAAR